MDISGDHQGDLSHNIKKTRVSQQGYELETLKDGRELPHPGGQVKRGDQLTVRAQERCRACAQSQRSELLWIMLWRFGT